MGAGQAGTGVVGTVSAASANLSEAALLRSLDHSNIIRFYGYESGPEGLGLVLEYMDGGSLADLLQNEGPVPPERAISLMIPICKGVAFAHSKNVIHRDLKPENILLNTEGHVKVGDFGVARVLEGTKAASTAIGTPYYMAPEQFKGRYDQRVDVYALGCVLYFLASGEPPFTGTPGEVMEGHMMEPPRVPEGWPGPIRDLVARCLSKDASGRPADAGAVLREIERMRSLAEDPEATGAVKRAATMFVAKRAIDPDATRAVRAKTPATTPAHVRGEQDQAQALVDKADECIGQGDFAHARRYLEGAKEADGDLVASHERLDRLEVLEKAWPRSGKRPKMRAGCKRRRGDARICSRRQPSRSPIFGTGT
jgi:serine/threonine-protein kinase